MSLTSFVPAFVPSLTHNSRPFDPSLAQKKTRFLNFVRPVGPNESCAVLLDGSMSSTSFVPFFVPSLTHNSRPAVPLLAVKKTRLPTTRKSVGSDESGRLAVPVPVVLLL